MADEDVIQFGEELARVGEILTGEPTDELRQDYQSALDSYQSARRMVDKLTSAEAAGTVIDTLTAGRYALACARARLTGAPLPERRTPCFFNPQHGPSSTDVVWTAAYGPTRRVPACAQDAARIRSGEDPVIRMVRHGEQQVPAWEVGAPNEPYLTGFFTASGARAQIMELKMRLKGEGRGQWGTDLGTPKPRRAYD